MKQSVRKTWLTILGAFFLLVALTIATACAPKQYTLAFETYGGTQTASITAEAGAEITPPADPEKEGFTFQGWYLTADFSGNAVQIPTTMPEENITYHARFTEIPRATLTLDAGEGTLTTATREIYVGENLAAYLANVTPVAPTGTTFAGWFRGNELLSDSETMPANGLTLTARYTVGYAVEIYLQDAEGDGYTLNGEAASRTGFVGSTITRTVAGVSAPQGFTFILSLSPEITLTTDASQNVYRAYFNRTTSSIYYVAGAPAGTTVTGEMERESGIRHGASVTVKESAFEIEGYRFAGWATSEGGEVIYAPGDTFEMGASSVWLYARWNFGTTNTNGGSDRIYILAEKTNTALLSRIGLGDREGEYDPVTRIFTFREGQKVMLRGRISADGKTFVYMNDEVEGTYTQYDWTAAMPAPIQGNTLRLDGFDGAVYTAGSIVTQGTYAQDGAGFTFTPDDPDGEAFYFVLDRQTFRISDGVQGTYSHMTAEGRINYPLVQLDGFGAALYLESSSADTVSADYVIEENGRVRVMLETPIVCALRNVEITTGGTRDVYTVCDTFKVTTETGNVTLETDGFNEAVYTDEQGRTQHTVCEYQSGYLDGQTEWGYILFLLDDGEGISRVRAIRYDTSGAQESVLTTYEAYEEYEQPSGYYIRLRTQGSTVENEEEVYLATLEIRLNSGMYRKIADGTYVANETQGYYTFTVTEIDEESVTQAEVLEAIKLYFGNVNETFIFGLFRVSTSSGGTATVFVVANESTGTYTFELNGANLTLDCDGCGNATLTEDGNGVRLPYAFTEGYEEDEHRYAFISFTRGETLYYVRVDLNDKTAQASVYYNTVNGSFQDLNNRFTTYENETLRLFPDGTAIIYVAQEEVLRGTYTAGDEQGFYTLAADKVNETFVLVRVGNSLRFSIYDEGEIRTITQGNSSLALNGYGLAAYNGAQYVYTVHENEITLETANGSRAFVIRLDEESFTVSGEEAGRYLAYVNNTASTDELIVELNGFGVVTLYRFVPADEEAGTPSRNDLIATGTYVAKGNGEYAATFDDETQDFDFILSSVSIQGLITIPVYVKADANAAATYRMPDEGTIAVDVYGRVTYTPTGGEARSARISILSDSYVEGRTLLAMYNEAGTSVTAIYVVGTENTLRLLGTEYGMYSALNGNMIGGPDQLRLILDGFNGARLINNAGQTTASGVYAPSETVENAWIFTPEEGEGFSFVVTAVNDTAGETHLVYRIYREVYDNAVFVSDRWAVILLDGYGSAIIVDEAGRAVRTYYIVYSDTVIGLANAQGGYDYYEINFEDDSFVPTQVPDEGNGGEENNPTEGGENA